MNKSSAVGLQIEVQLQPKGVVVSGSAISVRAFHPIKVDYFCVCLLKNIPFPKVSEDPTTATSNIIANIVKAQSTTAFVTTTDINWFINLTFLIAPCYTYLTTTVFDLYEIARAVLLSKMTVLQIRVHLNSILLTSFQ